MVFSDELLQTVNKMKVYRLLVFSLGFTYDCRKSSLGYKPVLVD